MGRTYSTEDEDLLVRVSWWYHIDNMTQDAIAARLRLSRPSVGRLLDKARALGITEVRVSSDYLKRYQVAQKIKEKYNLLDVMVVPAPATPEPHGGTNLARLGKAAATVVEEYTIDAKILAIGWGDAVATTFANLQTTEKNIGHVVSLTGGVSVYAMAMAGLHGQSKLTGITRFIPAPLFVQTSSLATALCEEISIASHLDLAGKADLAVIGVGGNTSVASLVKQELLTEAEIEQIRKAGAAGDILGFFFDHNGKPLDIDLHQRRIGISLKNLHEIPTVIGVAGGKAKIPSILGALKGHYLDVLVTDMDAALALGEIND